VRSVLGAAGFTAITIEGASAGLWFGDDAGDACQFVLGFDDPPRAGTAVMVDVAGEHRIGLLCAERGDLHCGVSRRTQAG
jgi:hypothetical protein